MSQSRTIQVNALTRVEGEGGLHVKLKGDVIENVQLAIYEPPRFFEAFLRGRSLTEVPDIVARICGICPVAEDCAGRLDPTAYPVKAAKKARPSNSREAPSSRSVFRLVATRMASS